ncbi:FecCD family ABC transporter permease [Macrococcoides caseolyticum]|uniref:FecCD family ABC transporter permease n=1 Tax=Macrococcoides caseolyticum TaxID=69966 RepID=UPI001F30BFD1|nr:iron ABC transporter permease [Macrococcus caseolyticus]MCE4958014.1 iron ABC transporter permease [Macrococcus caseolyticus]
MRYVVNIVLFICSILLSLMLGDSFVQPLEVIKALFQQSDDYTNLIINTLRLPRVLLAVMTGAALGIAGCLLQRVTKNDLASPDVIGISQGAVVGSLFFLVVLTSQSERLLFPIAYQSVASMLGAIIVTWLLYHFALKGAFKKERLILMGICLNIFFHGMTMFLIMSSSKRSAQAQIWITGSVHLADYLQVIVLCIAVIITLIIIAYFTKHLDIHQMGKYASNGLGLNYYSITLMALLFVSILTGLSMSFVGGIQFVGLIAPHIASRMRTQSFIGRISMSGLIGSIIVLLSDLLGRTLFLPVEVPAGVFTALIGAPFFIYLLFYRRVRKA